MCISKILSYFAGETKKENVNLVIDIGNTVAKLALTLQAKQRKKT